MRNVDAGYDAKAAVMARMVRLAQRHSTKAELTAAAHALCAPLSTVMRSHILTIIELTPRNQVAQALRLVGGAA